MEAFKIHVQVTTKWGKKTSFVNEKISACTGWEAFYKTREFVNRKLIDVATVELEYWKVLDPYLAHFNDQPIITNQKREK
jgi:hypothetical protein